MMNEPSGGGGPVIAVVGSVPSAPQAGMPLMVVPGGYTATQRRPIGVGIAGGAYDELNMIGVGYVIEQSTKLRQSPAMIDPALVPLRAHRAGRAVREPRALQPRLRSRSTRVQRRQAADVLPFSLETTSAASARGNDEREDS